MQLQIRGRLTSRTDLLIGLAGIAILVIAWCAVTYGGLVKPLFLPTPSGIWEGLGDLHSRGDLFPAIWRSFWRVTRALALVVVIGIPIGVFMGAFPTADAGLRKIMNGAKSVPTTGLVALIVLWFGIEERAMLAYLFMGAIFYMIILVKNAVLSVNEDYVRVALDIGAGRTQTVFRVLLPGALPQIWDAIAVCNGIMWTYIVLVEMIHSNQETMGLGTILNFGSRANESGQVFGMLIIIGVLSSTTDFLLQGVRRKWLNW